MEQTFDEIAELAEDLGNHNLVRGKVNLAKIAKQISIVIVYGHYDEFFLGELVHVSKRFYIHLNLDKLPDKKSARTRFTIAHELGHYFIDSHRIKLAKGISLSYTNDSNHKPDKQIERQASHFASHLLMPKKHFIRSAQKLEPGLSAILSLRKRFDTSIESTLLHYIDLNITTNIMIRWHPDLSFHYSPYSKSFSQLTGITGKTPIKFNSEYISEQIKIIEKDDYDYIETVTTLSRWISTVIPGTTKDFVGIEQTIKLGDFGGITLLTFNQ